MSIGGSSTSPATKAFLTEAFEGVSVRDAYGTTEVGGISTNNWLNGGSMGKLVIIIKHY
jgi:long-subunit acyl-CoA synthetase (AMP-forming)